MTFFAVRPDIQQRIAILVPLVALALSLLVVYPTWGRYGDLTRQVEQQQAELRDLKAAPVIMPGPIAPAAEDMPSEPPQFLGQLRTLAVEANSPLVGFDLSPSDKAASYGPVRAVRATIDIEAGYVQIRDFLFRFSHLPRLSVVTGLTLATIPPSKPGVAPTDALHATFEIERYVASQVPEMPAPTR